MTPTLEATMRRLCELEPERFQPDDWAENWISEWDDKPSLISLEVGFGTKSRHIAYFGHKDPDGRGIGHGIILAAIMAAIEARGWVWSLTFDRRVGTHFALVAHCISRGRGRNDASAPSALEGLAQAYVQALEAEQGGEG